VSRRSQFDVVAWIRKTDTFPALRDELIGLAVLEPDESSEWNEMVAFHWGFDRLMEGLLALSMRPCAMARAAEHGSLEGFQSVDLAFGLASAPWLGDGVPDGVDVAAQHPRELL
jgi:hypothetical protein